MKILKYQYEIKEDVYIDQLVILHRTIKFLQNKKYRILRQDDYAIFFDDNNQNLMFRSRPSIRLIKGKFEIVVKEGVRQLKLTNSFITEIYEILIFIGLLILSFWDWHVIFLPIFLSFLKYVSYVSKKNYGKYIVNCIIKGEQSID